MTTLLKVLRNKNPRYVGNELQNLIFHATKDYFITGRANVISCAVGLR